MAEDFDVEAMLEAPYNKLVSFYKLFYFLYEDETLKRKITP